MPSNSGYIALHIFQANCLHPRQAHLSATKSISLSHTFENRQAFSKLSQKSCGEGGKKTHFRKVYEQDELNFHIQVMLKYGFYKVPPRKNLL